jgi:hypothetical protein
MATKKILKRAMKSVGDEESTTKIKPINSTVNSGESLNQLTQHVASTTIQVLMQPTLCSSNQAGDAQGELKLMFAPQRYVVYTRFRDAVLVHIREFAAKTSGSSAAGVSEYPTKKGVCLTPGRLFMLRSKLNEIDEHLKLQNIPNSQPPPAYRCHIGNGIYISTGGQGFNCVDIRRYWVPEGQATIAPTRRGICLSPHYWNLMKEKLHELLVIHPELDAALPCIHDAQEEMMQCRECMPFGWMSLMV